MALTKVIGNGLGTLGDGTANDTKIVFNGNAQNFHIGLDDSTDSLTIGLGSALGTTTHMKFDANGQINKPLQPAFCATLSSHSANAIPTSGVLTMPYDSERYDQNGDYNNSTYYFTAPIDGRYLLTYGIYLFNHLDNEASYYLVSIDTSNRDYESAVEASVFGGDVTLYHFNGSVIADMDANDTARIYIQQSYGTQQTDISSTSHFSGALIC